MKTSQLLALLTDLDMAEAAVGRARRTLFEALELPAEPLPRVRGDATKAEPVPTAGAGEPRADKPTPRRYRLRRCPNCGAPLAMAAGIERACPRCGARA